MQGDNQKLNVLCDHVFHVQVRGHSPLGAKAIYHHIQNTTTEKYLNVLRAVHTRELAPETRSRVSTPASTHEGHDEGAE